MVDKNLFLYDLAIVAIMKGEEHYVKEWLDYHLLAGVDHFYIYDNDSTPDFKKILQPYIDANIVSYIHYPGKARQFEAYNDAFKRVRFECRYMAIVDGDEFIFPKSKSTITEIVDEVLSKNPNAASLSPNWRFFGSNGLEKADYNIGVLDRFTKRAKNVDRHTKTIANPRKIDFFQNSHYAIYFSGCYAANENGKFFAGPFNEEQTAEKICIHHYHTKSYEEYVAKRARGDVIAFTGDKYGDGLFKVNDCNDEIDEGIIKYRDARRAALIPQGGGYDALFPRKQINPQRLFNALVSNLITTTVGSIPRNFYEGKVENFLTCLNLIGYLRGKLLDDNGAKIFEELSLNALYKSMVVGSSTADILLLISELPKILDMNYSAVKKIRDACINIIPQIMTHCRMYNQWQKFTELEYTLKLLKKIN